MKAPESLETLVDYGIIQEVIRPLMSGKEAQVYVVVAGGEECVAKVYKEASQRTFKHRSEYTEGRRGRNTRDQRAMNKRSQHGRKLDEDAWRSTEADMIYRLRDAGVRVPKPINFVDGVLVMELVKDAEGQPAPRLGDLTYSASEAYEIYLTLIRDVVRMLCAGVIHGDLSDFNVLMSREGPVLIDFPQSVDPAQNPNGRKLLLRDVENLHRFLARFAPDQAVRPYGQEIWSLYQENKLAPDTKLSGQYQTPKGKTNTKEVIELIEDARRDERMRREGRRTHDDEELDSIAKAREKAPFAFRTVVEVAKTTAPRRSSEKSDGDIRAERRARRRRVASEKSGVQAQPAAKPVAKGADSRKRRRRRRRGIGTSESSREARETTARSELKTGDAAKPGGSQQRRGRGRGRPRKERSPK